MRDIDEGEGTLVRRRGAAHGLVAAALVALSLLTVFAIELSDTEAKSKRDVQARVHERAVLAAALIDSLFQTVGQQVPQDARTYGTRIVNARTIDKNQQDNVYLALLNDGGSVLAYSRGFTPQARADLSRSAALRLVRAGHPYGLGNTLPYGTTGVINLAVRFPTQFGARTLVTGIRPSSLKSFLGGELSQIPGVKGATNYLIDGNDTVIASNNPARPAGYVFRHAAQVQALAKSSGDRNGSYYNQVPLSNSTWRILLAAPAGPLFASVEGLHKWVPWAIFVAFALVAVTAIMLGGRVLRSAEKMHEANLRLENASQAKNRFLANMSHELRTPLNGILGFTGTLLMGLPGPLNDEQTKQLRTVQSSGKHLLSLINDLLDLAKIESGKRELKIEPINGRDLLEEVAVGLRPFADKKGIDLQVLAPREVAVNTDRRALAQILINLANNAIKFTDEGEVALELTQHLNDAGTVTRFNVIDTGYGIEPGDQERLFAAFVQIGGAGANPYEGTGLGLYICQTLATLIGAAITFQSELGKGTTFTLELRE
jgi:signal transduction histidine kinase